MDLLVVDWDYFFPTPTAGAPLGSHDELFAWPAAEDPMFVEAIWLNRVRPFIERGLPLPGCEGWKGFWDRFSFSPHAWLLYADSNAWAGQLFPSDVGGEGPWDSVHLYDAHHDCGYKPNNTTFDEWKTKGAITAENWMLAHYWAGSKLFVHLPPWRESMSRPAEAPLIPVRMEIDDGFQKPALTYSMVFVCRSGAWVPPWNDDQFDAFIRACPVKRQAVHPQNMWRHPRDDVVSMARIRAQRRS
ncbi:hypothetical protein [Streptomyces synnematoformans]|uniref:Uncharacterized protein n=1 Tax=Streptomyces synnematoformans TaxID=415721 RepID=A0ABP5JKS0_9ACTN